MQLLNKNDIFEDWNTLKHVIYKVIHICSECNLYILCHCIRKLTKLITTLITIPSQ